MKIKTLHRTIATLTVLLCAVNAAEINYATTWTLTTDLPEKKQDVDLSKYTPILLMESNSPSCLLREIMVEVLPTSAFTANAFGLHTTEDVTSVVGAKMPNRICVNFTPTKSGIVDVLKNFVVKKFGNEDIFGFGTYIFTNYYIHDNGHKYASISFKLNSYKNVKIILDHLATTADLSEADRAILSQAYTQIEACTTK